MEVILIIATLCQLSVGGMGLSARAIERRQLACHQYYIKCLAKERSANPTENMEFEKCIMKRIIN